MSVRGLYRACSSYMQASSAFLDALQCNPDTALWSRDLTGEAWVVPAVGASQEQGAVHTSTAWLRNQQCSLSAWYQVKDVSYSWYKPGRAGTVFFHSCDCITTDTGGIFDVDRSWVGIYYVGSCLCNHLLVFLFSLVNDQTNFLDLELK